MQQPGLQGTPQYVAGLLQHSPALATLDLSGCQLSERMVTYLCAALRYPGCRLQTLRWRQGREECREYSLSTLGGGRQGFSQTLKWSPSAGPPA